MGLTTAEELAAESADRFVLTAAGLGHFSVVDLVVCEGTAVDGFGGAVGLVAAEFPGGCMVVRSFAFAFPLMYFFKSSICFSGGLSVVGSLSFQACTATVGLLGLAALLEALSLVSLLLDAYPSLFEVTFAAVVVRLGLANVLGDVTGLLLLEPHRDLGEVSTLAVEARVV